MIDLGSYAGTVLGAYGVTLALITGLVFVSWRRGARVRDELARLERQERKSLETP